MKFFKKKIAIIRLRRIIHSMLYFSNYQIAIYNFYYMRVKCDSYSSEIFLKNCNIYLKNFSIFKIAIYNFRDPLMGSILCGTPRSGVPKLLAKS